MRLRLHALVAATLFFSPAAMDAQTDQYRSPEGVVYRSYEFGRATSDFYRGLRADGTNYGILYHQGIVHYAQGEFVREFLRTRWKH